MSTDDDVTKLQDGNDRLAGRCARLERELSEARDLLDMDEGTRAGHLAELLTSTVHERDAALHVLEDKTGRLRREVEADLLQPLQRVLPDAFTRERYEDPEGEIDWAINDDGQETTTYSWRLVVKDGWTLPQVIEQVRQMVVDYKASAVEAEANHAHIKEQYDRSLNERLTLKERAEQAETAAQALVKEMRAKGQTIAPIPPVTAEITTELTQRYSKSAAPGDIAVFIGPASVRESRIAVLRARKPDDSGWWCEGGGGLADHVIDGTSNWVVLSDSDLVLAARLQQAGVTITNVRPSDA